MPKKSPEILVHIRKHQQTSLEHRKTLQGYRCIKRIGLITDPLLQFRALSDSGKASLKAIGGHGAHDRDEAPGFGLGLGFAV